MICQYCQGKGVRDIVTFPPCGCSDRATITRGMCTFCNGTGQYVPIIVTSIEIVSSDEAQIITNE